MICSTRGHSITHFWGIKQWKCKGKFEGLCIVWVGTWSRNDPCSTQDSRRFSHSVITGMMFLDCLEPTSVSLMYFINLDIHRYRYIYIHIQHNAGTYPRP